MKFMKLGSMLSGLAAVVAVGVSNPAMAGDGRGDGRGGDNEVSSILYSCNLSFRATGRSVYLGIGYTDIHGSGTISCYDLLTGVTQHLPIKVKARGPGAGLGITGLVLSGAATGIGVAAGPENLIGRYVTVRGNAAVGVGAGAGLSLRLSKGAVTLDANIEAQTGLGAGVDLLWVELERDGDIRTEAPPAKPAPEPEPERREPPRHAPPQEPAVVTVAPSKVIYLSEGQPLQIVDSKGRLIQTIYLKAAK